MPTAATTMPAISVKCRSFDLSMTRARTRVKLATPAPSAIEPRKRYSGWSTAESTSNRSS